MTNRIKEVRIDKGISQKELAERLGIKAPTLSQIENGKNAKIETLKKIADALDCDVSDLLPRFTLINEQLQEMIDNAGYTYEGVKDDAIKLKDKDGVIHLVNFNDVNDLYGESLKNASAWFRIELARLIEKSDNGNEEN